MQTTIYLARHGTTMANLENRFAGRSQEPLHQLGRQQITELTPGLKEKSIGAIYAGPLPRTIQSAEIISTVVSVPVIAREAFNEIHIPHWDNLTKEEITRQFGPEYPTWLNSPEKFKVAGCETISQVQERAVEGVTDIIAKHDGMTVLVVSHLIVIRCVILYFRGMSVKNFRDIKVNNASLTRLSAENGKFEVSTE